ncbi:hypothetical protein ANCDUO_05758 [Ancylostoma duodenale]|uniref:Reverse transcriptase domain-containing protein n=1 Tax=Ancylostoma duodenale TaxID=51022 RepID=A0A0C2DMU2_9BILA|nr:hypothetical protein ANCDUO_05758 [Ancylostoma duodenale]
MTLNTVVKHLMEGTPSTFLYADDVALMVEKSRDSAQDAEMAGGAGKREAEAESQENERHEQYRVVW